MVTKKWFQSKIIWTNLIPIILEIINLINADILTSIGITNPTKVLTILGLATGILTIIFRSTGTPTMVSSAPSGTPVSEVK